MEVLYTFLVIVVMVVLGIGSEYLRRKYLTDEKVMQLRQAEFMAETFVKAAEQKINLVLDTTEAVLTPEQSEQIKAQRKLYNQNKKRFVMEMMTKAFPSIDADVLDVFVEAAVLSYKEYRKEVDAKLNSQNNQSGTQVMNLLSDLKNLRK